MAGTPFKDGPAYVASSIADLYVPGSGTYALIKHIRLINKDASARTVSLYVGATGGSAGGTEIETPTFSLTAAGVAGSTRDIYFPAGLKLTATDFLTGVASSASTVVCIIAGELYVA